MNRKEALEHFEETYVKQKGIEKMKQAEAYYKEHKDELVPGFVESFRQICIKIKEMQDKGTKDKIGYITYSLRRTNMANREYTYIVEAFNEDWFYDKVECRGEYDVSWAFKFLDEFEEELEDKRKLYVDKITKADMDRLRIEHVGVFHARVLDLARYAMPEAAKLKEYQEILKHEVIEVRVGEQKGISEVVYKEDIRVKDAAEIKEWLEEKEEGAYDYEILKNLDLSEGDYDGISLKRGDLSGSNLSKSSLKKCSFLGTNFEGCNLENADFTEAILFDTNLRNANMKGAVLYKVDSGNMNFENADMENINMSEADISFSDIKNANLKNANFRGADLFGTCFEGSNLEGSDFQDAELEQVNFKGALLEQVNFKGANLEDAVFLKKDIENLKLDEEQKKVIIIEE